MFSGISGKSKKRGKENPLNLPIQMEFVGREILEMFQIPMEHLAGEILETVEYHLQYFKDANEHLVRKILQTEAEEKEVAVKEISEILTYSYI